MNDNRIWVVGAVLLAAVIVVLGWMIGVQPQLSAVKAANSGASDAQLQNQAAEASLAALKDDHARMATFERELTALRVQVPGSADISSFTRAVVALEQEAGVKLLGLTVADGQPYLPIVPDVAATATPADEPSDGATSVDATAPAAAPVASSLVNETNLVLIPIEIQITGRYSGVMSFLGAMQAQTRLFLVTGFTTAVNSTDTSKFDSTIGGFIYVLRDGLVETGGPAPE